MSECCDKRDVQPGGRISGFTGVGVQAGLLKEHGETNAAGELTIAIQVTGQ